MLSNTSLEFISDMGIISIISIRSIISKIFDFKGAL